jgi:DtxR family Mn-dependent transcriptional regulator
MATSTVEDYLKRLFLEEGGRGGLVPMGGVAAAMAVAPGTATAMAKALAARGLVRYEPYAGVRLTRRGRRDALRTLRRHRLVELLLVRTLGMDWAHVHEDAERIEHAVSNRLLDAIDRHLGFPVLDPHGDPIPTAAGRIDDRRLPTLANCAERRAMVVVRITDQSARFLRAMGQRGLRPGARVRVVERSEAAGTVTVQSRGGRVVLGRAAAEAVLVRSVRKSRRIATAAAP